MEILKSDKPTNEDQRLQRPLVLSARRLCVISGSYVNIFYRCALHLRAGRFFEEGSRFHRDPTSDVLFIELEEIRHFSPPSLSSKWEIFVSLRAC